MTDPNSGQIEEITDVKVLTKAFLEDVTAENNNEEDENEEVKEVVDGVAGKDNRDIVDNN